MNLLSVK